MSNRSFTLLARDEASQARRGRLRVPHGRIETPAFMPVGTQGAVKAMTPAQLVDVGAQIILGNTYHLNLRPGVPVIRKAGGLRRFMGWEGPILTDSGGFQAFSLGKLCSIGEEGIAFRSHLDGAPCFLGPREAMEIQMALGSDIAMAIDECPPWPCERSACARAVERTTRWAEACKRIATEAGFLERGHLVFGIVQGSSYADLRQASADALAAMDFPGYAIGGVSVGEPEPEMFAQVAAAAPRLPEDRPRYAMGLGSPPQLLKMIALGVDLFDCVLPCRVARNGAFYTPEGLKNVRNARYATDFRPLWEGLDNYADRNFSRAYARHLILAKEMLGCTLITIHNLHFYLDLMRQARERLEAGDFLSWSRAWADRYEAGDRDV